MSRAISSINAANLLRPCAGTVDAVILSLP